MTEENKKEKELSEKAKENLRKNAESRSKDSKFIKAQAGEKMVLNFDAEKMDRVPAEFNGRKTIRYRYTVTEPNNGSQEKYLEVGKRISEDIDSYLSEGHTLLKIQRFGLERYKIPRNTCFLSQY
jgi:hypothetical protein